MSTAIYSCDDHLDLRAVPPELWSSRLSRADVERGPRVVERDGRVGLGLRRPRPGRERLRRSPPVSASAALNAIGRAGIDDDGYRAGNARLRLEDLDRDGLAASVVYGPLAIGLPIEDPDLAGRVLRGVERLGRRRLQRRRARPAHHPAVPAQQLGAGRGGRARALRRQGTPRRDHRRLRHGPRRPGVGSPVERRPGHADCRSASTSRVGRGRDSATRSGSGRPPRSRRSCRSSSTRSSPR